MSVRPLPPYSLLLRRWLRADPKLPMWGCAGDTPAVTIAIGATAWAWARRWYGIRLNLVLPPGESPARFDWRLCSGCDPVLLQACGTVPDGAIDSLVNSLLRDGTERVLDVDSGTEFFAEAVQHAA